jgi:hypothetical protein
MRSAYNLKPLLRSSLRVAAGPNAREVSSVEVRELAPSWYTGGTHSPRSARTRVSGNDPKTDAGKGVRLMSPRLSRLTKQPMVRRRNGQAEAARLLSIAEVADGLRLDAEALEMLRRCSTHPPRNAASAVAAIKLRLEFSQPKPKQKVQHSGSLEVTRIERVIVDPAKP